VLEIVSFLKTFTVEVEITTHPVSVSLSLFPKEVLLNIVNFLKIPKAVRGPPLSSNSSWFCKAKALEGKSGFLGLFKGSVENSVVKSTYFISFTLSLLDVV
jgi:hypothetical protein